jgi:hypothetical protein
MGEGIAAQPYYGRGDSPIPSEIEFSTLDNFATTTADAEKAVWR